MNKLLNEYFTNFADEKSAKYYHFCMVGGHYGLSKERAKALGFKVLIRFNTLNPEDYEEVYARPLQ